MCQMCGSFTVFSTTTTNNNCILFTQTVFIAASTLKIQDDGWLPCWNFKFAIYSLNCSKSNTEENTSNLVILEDALK